MKKIAIAFGIIACLAVLSLLLTSASAQEEEEEEWIRCPGGGWENLSGYYLDPAKVHYEKRIIGQGYEDCRATIATRTWNEGLGASTSSRGSAYIDDYQMFDVDTHPGNPRLNITSWMLKTQDEITFVDELVKPLNRSLSGETCVKSYKVGAMVSERYMDTYYIAGHFNHTGNATLSSTTMDRLIYGTSRFAVTVKDIENRHHTIMRLREEHTGEFSMARNVTVERYDVIP